MSSGYVSSFKKKLKKKNQISPSFWISSDGLVRIMLCCYESLLLNSLSSFFFFNYYDLGSFFYSFILGM